MFFLIADDDKINTPQRTPTRASSRTPNTTSKLSNAKDTPIRPELVRTRSLERRNLRSVADKTKKKL